MQKYIEAGIPFKIAACNTILQATVIGVCGDEALIEYVFLGEADYSALRIVNVYDNPLQKSLRRGRNVTYTDDWSTPKRFPFIESAALNKREWVGRPRHYVYDGTNPIHSIIEIYEAAMKTYKRRYVKKEKV